MSAKPFVVLFACLSLSLVGGMAVVPVAVQDQDAEQITEEARKQFMRGKLESNQKIVEGLSLKNFDLIRDGADGVTALVKGQHWFVLDTPEYREFSKDMEQAAQRLSDAAKDKNIEAAALRYFDVTLNCIDCHTYIETQSR